MNHYGAQLRRHWQQYRQAEFAELESRGETERFFTELGNQISTAIDQRQHQIEQATPQSEDYVAELQRLNAAKQQAADEILKPMLLIETGTNQPPQPEEHSTS